MFHLFTLQGKRIDAQLEQLPKNIRVHHAKSNNRIRKFSDKEARGSGTEKGFTEKYGADVYREELKHEPEKTPVFHAAEIMSFPVITITRDVHVNDAWFRFANEKVHHMPVVNDEGEIIGIISDRDLLKKLIIKNEKIDTIDDVTVGDIMSKDVIATTPLTDIRRIAKAMLDHHINAMPVVNDEGSIQGIITGSDILYAIIHHQEIRLWA